MEVFLNWGLVKGCTIKLGSCFNLSKASSHHRKVKPIWDARQIRFNIDLRKAGRIILQMTVNRHSNTVTAFTFSFNSYLFQLLLYLMPQVWLCGKSRFLAVLVVFLRSFYLESHIFAPEVLYWQDWGTIKLRKAKRMGLCHWFSLLGGWRVQRWAWSWMML